jgi:uncharacterized protein (DUF433 family)
MGQVRTLIGRGIYDADELARLSSRPVREISRWASAPSHGGGLLFPADRRLFSFWDLVTARVVGGLLDKGVPLVNIRDAREHLAQRVETQWPLAHFGGLSRLANVGRNVYFDDGPDGAPDWLDATLGGQAPLALVITPMLERLEFDDAGLALSWRPRDGVVLRPAVQAGTPCVEGTRIATRLLADLFQQGERVRDLADDYELSIDLVRRAIKYETDLTNAA